jgi:hypothetical protein
MNDPKYICIDYDIGGYRYFIFPNFITHKDFANKLSGKKDKIVSAGFVRIVDNKYSPYGQSQSLKLSPAEQDNRLMNLQFGIEL